MKSHVLMWVITAAYPFLHTVAAPMFLKWAPDPPPGKGWYSLLWHGVEAFALGNGVK